MKVYNNGKSKVCLACGHINSKPTRCWSEPTIKRNQCCGGYYGFFETVFPNYASNGNLRNISPIQNDLLNILRLRNRIFHHEIIIKSNKQPKEYYQLITNMLHLLSDETLELLKSISRFEEINMQKP